MKSFRKSIVLTLIAVLAVTSAFVLPKTADAETSVIVNGDFQDAYVEKTGLKPVYGVNFWEHNGSVKKNGDDYYIKSKEDTLVITQDLAELSAGTYTAGFSLDATEDLTVNFGVGENTNAVLSTVYTDGAEDVSAEFYYGGGQNVKFFISVLGITDTADIDDVYLTLKENPEEEFIPTLSEYLITEEGAYLRTCPDSAGLRFTGRVDKAFYENALSEHENVTVGMLIAPADYIRDCGFTAEELSAKGRRFSAVTANAWNNADTALSDGYYGFNCAIVNILTYNTDRTFCARTFLCYDDGDGVTYVYGNFNAESNGASVYGIALSAREDAVESGDAETLEVIDLFIDRVFFPQAEVTATQSGAVLEYVAPAGYFTLIGAPKNAVSVTVNGETADYSAGFILLDGQSSVAVTVLGVDYSLITAKVYRT